MTEKVRKQLGEPKNDMEKEILEYISPLIDEAAEKRIADSKLTLKGCVESCFKKGKKYEVKGSGGGFARISPERHFKWVCNYFGVSVPKGKSLPAAPVEKVEETPAPKPSGLSLDLDSLFDF
ncbi:MAG: hypothetical protein J1F04_01700 [Oscillospiraceae bacterium]|nr:hypothetical protein [Oscillospiraceae bacterium]